MVSNASFINAHTLLYKGTSGTSGICLTLLLLILIYTFHLDYEDK